MEALQEGQRQILSRLDAMQQHTSDRFDAMQQNTSDRFDAMQQNTSDRFDAECNRCSTLGLTGCSWRFGALVAA
jgi:DNA anti-recombination protein RmuC